MPTPEQLIHIPFDGGLDEYNDYIHIEPPNLIEAKNIIFPHDGAIEKRPGFINYISSQNVIGIGSPIVGTMQKLAKHKNSILVHDGVDLFSAIESANISPAWSRVGRVTPVVGTWTPITTGYQNVKGMDCIYVPNPVSADPNAGYIVIAYIAQKYVANNNFQVYCTIIDAITGATVIQGKLVSAGAVTEYYGVRLAVANNRVVVAYTDGIHHIYANSFLVTDPTNFFGEVLVANDVVINSGTFDIVGDNDAGGSFRVVHETSLPAGNLRCLLYDGTFTFLSSIAIAAQARAGVRGIGICVHNSTDAGKCLMIAKSNNDGFNATDVFLISANYNNPNIINGSSLVMASVALNTLSVTTTQLVCVEPASSTKVTVTVSSHASGSPANSLSKLYTFYCYGTSFGLPASNFRFHWELGAMSRPFTYNGRVYHHCDSMTDKSGILMDLQFRDQRGVFLPDESIPVAHTLPRITEDLFYQDAITKLSPSHVVRLGNSSKFVTVIAQQIGFYDIPKIHLLTYDFNHPGNLTYAELGDCTYFAGGLMIYYDGVHTGEVNFLQTPFSLRNIRTHLEVDNGIPTPPPTGVTPNGAYYYTLCFDHKDAAGQIAQSLFAVLDQKYVFNLIGAPKSVLCTYRSLYASIKKAYYNTQGYSPVYARFYRTNVNAQINGIYYNIYPDTFVIQTGTGTADNPGGFVDDKQPTSELTIHNYRYVTGDVLSNVAPPSSTHIINHKDRLWIIAGDQQTVWFSKKYTPGEQVSFCDEFTFNVTDNGLPLIALGSLDGNLVLFKEKSIYIVSGDGPPKTGYGGDLSEPQKINAEIGCINPRSILRIPQGLAFFSHFGLMLLTRSLDVDYFGKYVQNTVEQYPVILGACVDNERNLAIWSLAESETSAVGILLVYDFVENKFCTWEVDKYPTNPNKSRDIIFHKTKMYTISDRNNSVLVQSTNTYKDLSAYVEMSVRTAWVKPAGLQGFGRVPTISLIGQQQSTDHNLNLEIFYDYELNPSYTHQFPVAQINVLPIEQMSHSPQRNECQSISVRIKDNAGLPGQNGKGIRLEGISFAIMQESGPVRLPVISQS